MTEKNFRSFTAAITRIPPLSMANGITTQKDPIDVSLARKQHQDYLNALSNLGLKITLLTPEEDLPDSHFVEDAAIIYQQTAILTHPGALERRAEVASLKKSLPSYLTVTELSQNEEVTLDGGDVLFMADHVFIGISYRTNFAGANALGTILTGLNPKLKIHFIEFSGVLHLKSGLIALNSETLLGNPHLKLKSSFPFGNIIWLPENEGYAANALIVNGAALVFKECTKTQDILKDVQLNPVPLDLTEFRKMDGSFTCLSLLI